MPFSDTVHVTYIAGRFFESRLTLYEMCWHLRLFMSTFHFLLSHSFSQQWRLKANTRKSFIIYLFSGSMGGNVVHWPWLSVYLPRTTKDLQRPFQCWLILNIYCASNEWGVNSRRKILSAVGKQTNTVFRP